MTARRLIVNADDFGRSPGVDAGIARAHEHGIVTSASLMVRWPAAASAVAYASAHPSLSVGLHVDLGEWLYSGGRWLPVYEVVDLSDGDAVQLEVTRQLDEFRRLLGRDPTHLDSHQHVHRSDPTASVLAELAARLGVPLRDGNPHVRYCGAFYGQTGDGDPLPDAIRVEALARIVADLATGVTELGCHPGDGEPFGSAYSSERKLEAETLCDARAREALAAEEIELVSFAVLV